MPLEITNEEKIDVINTRIKNLKIGRYNLEVSLIEENSLDEPSEATSSLLTQEIANTNKRIEALELELTKL
jgi:hypothetical protein